MRTPFRFIPFIQKYMSLNKDGECFGSRGVNILNGFGNSNDSRFFFLVRYGAIDVSRWVKGLIVSVPYFSKRCALKFISFLYSFVSLSCGYNGTVFQLFRTSKMEMVCEAYALYKYMHIHSYTFIFFFAFAPQSISYFNHKYGRVYVIYTEKCIRKKKYCLRTTRIHAC